MPYKGLITVSDFSGAKDSSVIYDGSPHGIGTVKLRSEFADACSVVGPYYTGVNGTSYAKTTALPTGAGTYSVSAGIDYTAASGFRDTSIAVGTLTIRKATPTKGHFSIASSGGLTCSYDGAAHTVTASLTNSKLGGLGAVTVKYNGRSTGSPVGAGVYDIAVNIAEGANFSAVTDLWLGTLTINKIKPTVAHLSYPASASATYDGLPHAVSVSPKEDNYDGMGAITVKYSGSVTPPVGAGEYAVSADVADGLNFGSVSGLSLGKLAIRYSVTFESSGGSAVAAQAVLPGGVATAPAAPTKASNTFAGWYSDAGLTKLWNFPTDKVAGNMKLYARWMGSGTTTYTVSFNSNEGSAVDAQTVAKDGTVARPATPTKASSTFAGWYSDAGLTTLWNFPTDKVTASRTLYAKWIGSGTATRTVSFNSNGGSLVDPQTVADNSAIARPANPTKAGYAFSGWYGDAGLATPWSFSSGKVTGNMTLYAKWIAAGTTAYTVSFNSNGGSTVDPQTVAANGTIARPANPTRAGYTFAGWYADAGLTALWSFPAGKVTKETTLHAKWISTGEPTCKVSFNSNGGSAVDPQTVEANHTVARPASPTREGYTFAGWYGDAGLTALWSFPTGKVTADKTLYARWISAAIPYTASVDSSVT
ncbi:MAG: InlB B-repeat-containing protein, partial [Prevotellaceae bacterium]|nr:InlB B-repeat-containing protein [Prevotellaceae bacterium]